MQSWISPEKSVQRVKVRNETRMCERVETCKVTETAQLPIIKITVVTV